MTLSNLDQDSLKKENAFLKKETTFLKEENILLKESNTVLKEQLEWLKRQVFGPRSERSKPLNEGEMEFEGFDLLYDTPPEEENPIKPDPQKRKKPKRNGQDKVTLPEDIPVETTILDVPDSEKVCPETGEPLIKIGEEKTYRLAHKPGSYYVKETIRPKYAHPRDKDKGIKIADLPDAIIPKGKADESLLAEIAVQKFNDHLPLYRIAQIMKRAGISISRKLLSQWIVKLGLELELLYQEMLKKALNSKQLFMDETPVSLQSKGKCKKAYIWVMVGGKEGIDPPYRVYNFRESREHKHGIELLKNYRGIIHSDKYAVYEKLAQKEGTIWTPCWAHVRRKFFDIPGETPFKKYILRKIKYLFWFERIAWSRSPEKRLKIRKEKEEPIINELIEKAKEKLIEGKVLPKSNLGKALNYFCGLQKNLKTYLYHPYAQISNNVAERAIRPLAIGRKNWMFFGSKYGGKAGAILLSLMQTCKALKINPRIYLEDIFQKIMNHPPERISELLPDQWLLTKSGTAL